MESISRRGVLLGGAGLLLSGCASKHVVRTKAPVRKPGAKMVDGAFESRWMRTTTGWAIAYPPGHGPGDKLPVVVSLHGRRGNHRTSFNAMFLDTYLDKAVDAGTPAFAIASVDGGDHSYWHRRTDGTDASAMLREEFLPLLAHRGLDTDRLGLFGWSMGGYGALLMAGKKRLPTTAVAVSSPALFTAPGRTSPGAFDSPADFEANDVHSHPEWLRARRLRIDCGLQDPFYPATRDLAARLHPRPAGGFTPGAHTHKYWRKVLPHQMDWLGHALAGR